MCITTCFVIQAFRRLGGGKDGKKKMSWAEKQKAKKAAQNEETLDPVARQKKLEMDAITAIADKMMAFGVFSRCFEGGSRFHARLMMLTCLCSANQTFTRTHMSKSFENFG